MIKYVKGDVTNPRKFAPEGVIVIPHVLSETGAYDAGIAGAIASKWPKAYADWRDLLNYWEYDVWGFVQNVEVEDDLYVVNMCAQRGLRSDTNPVPLDYTLLTECLWDLSCEFSCEGNVSIHMGKIGCGLAGGDWKKVSAIVEETLEGFTVYVYEL